MATEQAVPPFVIFSDKALHEMSAQRPATDSEFLAVKGVGQNKLQKYGEQFMAVIRDEAVVES